jgi:hypothetical protein
VIVDLRNIYRPDEMTRLGFIYDSVGRATTPAPPSATLRQHQTTPPRVKLVQAE